MSSSNVNTNKALADSFATQVDASIQEVQDIASSEEKPGVIQRETDCMRDKLNEAFLTTFQNYDASADTGGNASCSTGLANIPSIIRTGIIALRGKDKIDSDEGRSRSGATVLARLATDLIRFETTLLEVQKVNLGDIHRKFLEGGQFTQNESLNIAFDSICQAITKRVTAVTEKTGWSVDDQIVVSEAKDILRSAAKKAVEFRRLTGSSMADDAGPTGEDFSRMKAQTMATLEEAEEVLAAKK